MLASGLDNPWTLALFGDNVYWGDYSGTIGRVAKAGGTPTILTSGQLNVIKIAVDASGIYWTRDTNASLDSAVMRMNLDGSGVASVAEGLTHPYDVATDANAVYFIANSALSKIAK